MAEMAVGAGETAFAEEVVDRDIGMMGHAGIYLFGGIAIGGETAETVAPDLFARCTMIRLVVALSVILLLAEPSRAQSIILNPMLGQGSVSQEMSQNFTGTCGGSVVRVLGVVAVSDRFFRQDLDTGDIVVRRWIDGVQEVSLKAANLLSDHNGVACVPGPQGDRLLVWSNCNGSACGDEFAFAVIDPQNVRILAPSSEGCDTQCAVRMTGSDLPSRINDLD